MVFTTKPCKCPLSKITWVPGCTGWPGCTARALDLLSSLGDSRSSVERQCSRKCFTSCDMHTKHLGILLKCRFGLVGPGLGILHLQQAPRWIQSGQPIIWAIEPFLPPWASTTNGPFPASHYQGTWGKNGPEASGWTSVCEGEYQIVTEKRPGSHINGQVTI